MPVTFCRMENNVATSSMTFMLALSGMNTHQFKVWLLFKWKHVILQIFGTKSSLSKCYMYSFPLSRSSSSLVMDKSRYSRKYNETEAPRSPQETQSGNENDFIRWDLSQSDLSLSPYADSRWARQAVFLLLLGYQDCVTSPKNVCVGGYSPRHGEKNFNPLSQNGIWVPIRGTVQNFWRTLPLSYMGITSPALA